MTLTVTAKPSPGFTANIPPMNPVSNNAEAARDGNALPTTNRRHSRQGCRRYNGARAPVGFNTRRLWGNLALAASLWLVVQPLLAQTSVWSGADAVSDINTNWADANNWIGGAPGPLTNVYFINLGANAAPGVANNLVGASITIQSLQYGNTNGFHTTKIQSGFTLAVSNPAPANLVFVGTDTDNGASQTTYASINGPGSLTVVGTNLGSAFVVQQGSASSGSHMATLDLSGLSDFSLTAGQLLVGSAHPSSGASNWLAGTLYLAATNLIRVNGATPAIDVGDAEANGATSYLYLGQTNAIFADSLTIAHSKATCTLEFNPALAGSNPVLSLSGNTNALVSSLTIGDFSAQQGSGSTCSGTVNLTAGRVNVQADVCGVGLGQTGAGSGPTTGVLSLGAGAFEVNTLQVGQLNSPTAVGAVAGTVNLTNGTLYVNRNLLLGYNPGATATVSGTLNVTNGTVLADTVTAGGGTVKINLQGGLLAVTNTLGTLASPLTALTLDQGATLQFWVTNHLTNAAVNAISSDNTGSITISAVPVYLTYPAQFPLLACAHSGASGVTFSVGTLPGTCQGYIYNDNSNTIWLVITNGPPLPKTDRWSGGVNGDWDTNSLNWTNNGSAVTYRENDLVIFDDSAQTGAVSLTGNAPHTPYAWAVTNNAHPYTFGGTNRISGDTGLTKSGGNSLTLAESGDSFSGGITVSGGTLILDEPTNNISGGLFIASGATAQIGNGDDKGNLPGGAITNNGTLDFSQTITNVVSAGISGTGTLRQNGSGTVELISPVTGTGNTVVLQGKLAVIGSGSIANSANVIISNATLDISGATGTALAGNLNLTNSTLALGGIPVNVAGLNLGGSSNVINLSAATLPGVFAYPTNFTLLQSGSAISGYNFVLGSLPAGLPAYAGSLAQVGNAVVLNLNTGPVIMASATVTFAATNPGYALNPSFCGLSYEKDQLTGSLFVSNNTSLISMFSQIGPAVLRIGGNSVDTTCWGGVSNLTPITAAQVSAFAGFVHALPTNWHVLYGLNMSVNSPTNCAAEAAYAANALGSSLLGFEIGNECDLYHGNGLRPTTFTYAEFLSEWQTLAGAITNTVPGWAITNGGSGWVFTGPVSAYNTSGYTVPFAANEQGVNSMLTQHYYRANGQDTNSTIAFLLTPDASLPGEVSTLAAAATANGLPDGFRMAECGSYYNGGAPNVSDAYGTALWALDYMFTIALDGGQGINFHGGGDGPGYTPIADNGTAVVQARPEFYGLKMFSLLCQGSAIPATITLTTNINFTAYGVRRPDGGISALLNNKQTNYYVQAAINLGSNVTAAQSISLAGPNLNATNGYTLGGAEINADGSWAGGVQSIIPASNGQLTFLVPPITALLLNPVAPPVLAITSPTPGQHVTNALATLSGTAGDNQGVADVWYQLDGGAWRLAATTNHWTNWTATVPLIAGTNTMAAYAVNLAGLDSPTNGLSVVSSNTFKLQLEIARAEPLTSNGLNFSLDLTAGVNGYIQVTTDLLSDWTTLADFTGSNSLLNFRDPAATNFNHRFYRAVIP